METYVQQVTACRKQINGVFQQHFGMMANTFVRHFGGNYSGRLWSLEYLRSELTQDTYTRWRAKTYYVRQPDFDFEQVWQNCMTDLEPVLAVWEVVNWTHNDTFTGSKSQLSVL